MREFTWVDGERTIHFGRGVAADAAEALGGPAYTLLTTERARGRPRRRSASWRWHRAHRRPGPGPRARRRPAGRGPAATGSSRSAAGAWSTSTKALARGRRGAAGDGGPDHPVGRGDDARAPARARRRRGDAARAARGRRLRSRRWPPRSRSTSWPRSSLNALGHAVEGPCTRAARTRSRRSPPTRPRGCSRAGWAGDEPDRETLALGALLAGYVIDSTGLGLHHVLAQTLVRVARARATAPRTRCCCRTRSRRSPRRCPRRSRRSRDVARSRPPPAAAHRRRAGLRSLGLDRSGSARPPTPPRRARSSPTRRRPPTAPRSSRSTKPSVRESPVAMLPATDAAGDGARIPRSISEQQVFWLSRFSSGRFGRSPGTPCRTFSGNTTRSPGRGRRSARSTSRCAHHSG